MKPTRIFVRAAACLLPLSLVLICVVTPIVLPAQDVTAKQPTEPAVAGEVRITDAADPEAELLETPAVESVATVESICSACVSK